jgi:uridine kinase
MLMAFLIGVTGGSGSGKTSICEDMIKKLSDAGFTDVVFISQDNFYKGVSKEDDVADYNFDHPDAIDFVLLFEIIQMLKKGSAVDIPIYDFATHKRLEETKHIEPTCVIIVEGILILNDPRIRELMNLTIYINTDSDLCFIRRLKRDTEQRKRTMQNVIDQYIRFVKPSYESFIVPIMKKCDIIINNNQNYLVGMDMAVGYIKTQIQK